MVSEGQTLDGTYRLMRLVSEGGMGTVYEATHARLAGRYAIKVLLPALSDNPEARACFDREARITSLLQHPNIVQAIDHNTTADGTSYLVMEYLSGESLAQRLARDGRLAPREVADIVEQIAAGLAAAHAHGIVHRDLKPDNVHLVPVEGRATALVKLLDFGISKANWCRVESDQQICGTPQYMAPEQAAGRAADVDGATDQWALAVIAHELLTGVNPFAAEGDGIAAAIARVLDGSAPPTGVSAEVDAVLARAMSRASGDRFASVAAFASAFRTALPAAAPEQTQKTQAPPPTARSSRGTRRRGGGARLGFAAAVAIACVSFVGSGAARRAAVNVAPVPVVVEPKAAPVEAEAAVLLPVPSPREAQVPSPREAGRGLGRGAIDESLPWLVTPEVRTPVRRSRPARTVPTMSNDAPALTIPTAARRRAAPTVLAPDDDATMAPSAF